MLLWLLSFFLIFISIVINTINTISSIMAMIYVTDGLVFKIMKLEKDKNAFVREAIEEKLEREGLK